MKFLFILLGLILLVFFLSQKINLSVGFPIGKKKTCLISLASGTVTFVFPTNESPYYKITKMDNNFSFGAFDFRKIANSEKIVQVPFLIIAVIVLAVIGFYFIERN